MNLEEVEARWRAGHVLTSDLPQLAEELIAAGHDVPAVRQLAGGEAPGAREARQTFERALRELGRGGMDASEAALVLARGWAEGLVRRRLPARRATRAIALVRLRGGPDVDDVLEPFSELLERYDHVGSGRLARLRALPLDRAARREAKRLLRGDSLRDGEAG